MYALTFVQWAKGRHPFSSVCAFFLKGQSDLFSACVLCLMRRAGRQGVSVTLVTQYDVELLQNIEKGTGKQMTEMEGVASFVHAACCLCLE